MTRKICIIPARMGSSRFPGKPLAPLLGLSLIMHIYHRCRLSDGFERIVVATCDREIHDAVESVGGEAVMTADTHERCTDRVSEAIGRLDLGLAGDDLVLMVQGDEVLVSPRMIDDMIRAYETERPPVVNLASRLYRAEDQADPNAVKVVTAPNGQALYMSRSPIPSSARAEDVPVYQQTGVIGFSAHFLAEFATLPQTPLEKIESCDMMRVIEHGLPIQVVHTETETIGVDTPADLRRAEDFLARDPVTARYMTVEAGIP